MKDRDREQKILEDRIIELTKACEACTRAVNGEIELYGTLTDRKKKDPFNEEEHKRFASTKEMLTNQPRFLNGLTAILENNEESAAQRLVLFHAEVEKNSFIKPYLAKQLELDKLTDRCKQLEDKEHKEVLFKIAQKETKSGQIRYDTVSVGIAGRLLTYAVGMLAKNQPITSDKEVDGIRIGDPEFLKHVKVYLAAKGMREYLVNDKKLDQVKRLAGFDNGLEADAQLREGLKSLQPAEVVAEKDFMHASGRLKSEIQRLKDEYKITDQNFHGHATTTPKDYAIQRILKLRECLDLMNRKWTDNPIGRTLSYSELLASLKNVKTAMVSTGKGLFGSRRRGKDTGTGRFFGVTGQQNIGSIIDEIEAHYQVVRTDQVSQDHYDMALRLLENELIRLNRDYKKIMKMEMGEMGGIKRREYKKESKEAKQQTIVSNRVNLLKAEIDHLTKFRKENNLSYSVLFARLNLVKTAMVSTGKGGFFSKYGRGKVTGKENIETVIKKIKAESKQKAPTRRVS